MPKRCTLRSVVSREALGCRDRAPHDMPGAVVGGRQRATTEAGAVETPPLRSGRRAGPGPVHAGSCSPSGTRSRRAHRPEAAPFWVPSEVRPQRARAQAGSAPRAGLAPPPGPPEPAPRSRPAFPHVSAAQGRCLSRSGPAKWPANGWARSVLRVLVAPGSGPASRCSRAGCRGPDCARSARLGPPEASAGVGAASAPRRRSGWRTRRRPRGGGWGPTS